jgi:hypothetical protein
MQQTRGSNSRQSGWSKELDLVSVPLASSLHPQGRVSFAPGKNQVLLDGIVRRSCI